MKNNKTNNLLTQSYDITVDQSDFDEVFFDSWNEHGFQSTGIAIYEFTEVFQFDDEFVRIYESLPKEIQNLNGSNYDDVTILIKQENIKSHLENHVFATSEGPNEPYFDMVQTIEKNTPENVEKSYFDSQKEKDICDGKFKNDLIEFAYKTIIDESKLTINGQKFYVGPPNNTRNFAQEYFDTLK